MDQKKVVLLSKDHLKHNNKGLNKWLIYTSGLKSVS